MSAGVTPARAHASSATGAIAVVAHRKTACPSCVIAPVRPVTVILFPWSPALPQTTGPIPAGSSPSDGPTTAAPAPSAKMMHVDRSFQSTQSVIFSAPMTSAFRALPAATASDAVPSA